MEKALSKRDKFKCGWGKAISIIEKKPWLTLLILYLAAVAVRIIMVFFASTLPSIMPDEMRYFQIAQSIAKRSEILMRGQPVNYQYILYPLLISPLFSLPDNVNVYRAIQVFNCIAIHLTIFPAYALSKRLTGSRRAGLFIALLTVFMPDMCMSVNIMTESVSYPLIALSLYLVYRAISSDTKHGVWYYAAGVSCFLCYALKPGYIAVGLALGLVLLVSLIKRRDKKILFNMLRFAGTMAVFLVIYMLILSTLLNVDIFQTTLYGTQNKSFSMDHIVNFLYGTQFYFVYNIIAFGLIPIAVLFTLQYKLEPEKRRMAWVVLLSILFSILITVWVIFCDEAVSNVGVSKRVHIRYTAMFFPALMTFLFTKEARDIKIRYAGMASAVFMCLGLVFFNTSLFTGNMHYPVDAMQLGLLHLQTGAWNGETMYLPIYVGTIVLIFVYILHHGFDRRARRVFASVIAVVLICNQCAAYYMDQYGRDRKLTDSDAQEALEYTDEDAWIICENGQEHWSSAVAIDIYSRCEVEQLTLTELADNANSDGTIDSAMPGDFRYTNPTYSYEQPSYLILTSGISKYAKITSDKYTTENHKYTIIPVSDSEPVLYSAITDLDDGYIQENSRLVLFNTDMLDDEDSVTIRISARSDDDSALLTATASNGQSQSCSVSDTLTWAQMTFDVTDLDGALDINLDSDSSIYISTYLVD